MTALNNAHQVRASYKAYLERKKLEEAEAKQKKAEEEAAASARRQAEKELEEEGKKRLSLEDSLKKAKTDQYAPTHRSREQVEEGSSNWRCDRHCSNTT